MVRITAVHMTNGGTKHEHIASVKWVNPSTNVKGDNTRAQMVDFINGGGKAQVADGRGSVAVGVAKASPPYIRTHADGRWTDNLLALPRY